MSERVVVTGLGAITPLGLTVKETWEGLVAGRSGVGPVTQFDASSFPTHIAGEVKGFDPRQYINFKEARRMARCSQLAIAAAQEALADAGLSPPFADGERVGVLIGSTVGGLDQFERGLHTLWERGLSRVSPFTVAAALPNMPAYHISRTFQAKGYNSTVSTACASGTQAIGEAAEVVRRGAADVMISGGVEAMICEATFAGFAAMRALSTRNEEPEKACRPFEAHRDGFVIAEGCALLILESLEQALKRGARIYAELLGYGCSSDAYHMAAPDPAGTGRVLAMRWALKDAGVSATDIDYINAHGPGTPLGDAIETQAIKTLFGEHAYKVPVSSTKSMIGHALGGSGAIEALACTLTIRDNVIHPTINYETPDPECDLDYVPNVARSAQVDVVLSNSFGLGGQNACLVLGRFEN
ncbi:MAG TPA: beta-ketoacyl-[acyl-carrier-protein] synthase II [Anaerolineae bacterium]|nr:beta-ketoacyl-[acyl-carrier-protein] synthase II [Anaerolineae bacterium]